ncbi:MAG TPA: glycine cleavage system H protein [Candidatus Lokiarchaeia archaeon]|nr:glycine cleavage system H protein [Candidatus Lokiarchaeia archaeon]
MSNIPTDLLYTRTHQYAKYEDGIVTVGITDFAQAQLGDIVFVDLRWDEGLKGSSVSAVTYNDSGEPAGDPISGVSVESQKAVGDIYPPVSGEIVEVNEALQDKPELINSDPYGEGWLFKVSPTAWDDESGTLLNADQYGDCCTK